MRINYFYLALPVFISITPSFLLQDTMGVVGIGICLLFFIYSVLQLMFGVEVRMRSIAYSYIIGFFISFIFYIIGAYLINYAQLSPWID